MKKIITILSFLFFVLTCIAQNVGIGTNTPHANAQLDIYGVNKGLLIPRGDNATRTALNSNTAKGLLMYDTVSNALWVHNGNGLASGWNNISLGANYWIQQGLGGAEIKNTNTGGFWSANPTAVLSDPGVITPPVSGGGTRLMWIPAKSAFRAGTVAGIQWDAGNIGSWSFAAGRGTIASGLVSTAMGHNTTASGDYSTAMGDNTTASEFYSTAMGGGTEASGNSSTAMGFLTNASGLGSSAMGVGTTASGAYSTTMGYITNASGDYSTAMGQLNTSRAYGSLAIGQYNDSISSSSITAWIGTDPVFYIGNGTEDNARRNAMVVYKNANVDISGYTRLGQSSESAPKIKMKEFTITSAATLTGESTPLLHGLTQAKIISATALMETANILVPTEYSGDLTLRYNFYITGTSIIIRNNATSGTNVFSKPVRVLVTYKE